MYYDGDKSEEQEKAVKKVDDFGSDYRIETEKSKSQLHNTLAEVDEVSKIVSETSTITSNVLPKEIKQTIPDPIRAEAHLLELLEEFSHHKDD